MSKVETDQREQEAFYALLRESEERLNALIEASKQLKRAQQGEHEEEGV